MAKQNPKNAAMPNTEQQYYKLHALLTALRAMMFVEDQLPTDKEDGKLLAQWAQELLQSCEHKITLP